MIKKEYYIIELGGAKEVNEMSALELNNVDQAIAWIQGSMESDAEYYDININCNIETLKYEQYDDEMDFYCKALVTIEYDSVVTHEMMESDIFTPNIIITSNLSIVSQIITKMVEV